MGREVQRSGAPEDDDARQQLASRGMLLAYWAALVPDKPAIVAPTGTVTFSSLNAQANRLARALRRRGLAAGDGVALVCGNRAEFASVLYATQRAGLRLTPVNWHLTGGEAAYLVGDCRARAIVADAGMAHVATEAVGANPACAVRLAIGGPIDGFEDFDAAIDGEDGADLADPQLGGTMLYTSGTTGRPKGVFRNEPAPRTVATMNLGGYRHDGDELHLCTGPLYHAAPLAFSLASPLSFGVGTVLMERWDPTETLRLIERHSDHAHPHGPDHVPPTALPPRRRAPGCGRLEPALRPARRRSLPRRGQAAAHRVARVRSSGSTTPRRRGPGASSTP